jgi:hypothetical protein
MNTISFFKLLPKIVFLTFLFSLCGCLHTKSGNTNFNRGIEITAASGNAYIDISGHISENIYAYNYINNDDTRSIGISNTAPEMPVVEQGKATITTAIILHETERFQYTLTTAEAVLMNIRSLDGNDVKIVVSEYGRKKEYVIDGKSQFGRMISFKN